MLLSVLLQNLPSLQQIRREKCQRNYKEFVKDSWKVLEPMTPYCDTWDGDIICEYLQAVKLRQIKRLLINVPPRTSKSYKTTIQLVPWWWIDEPHAKFINLSYADSLSKGHNIKKRDLITSHWYQQNWGDKFSLKEDLNTQRKFENDHTGMSLSSSVGGTLTGEGGDVIVFDDPHNPKKAESDAERTSTVEFFKSTLQTRLNNPKDGCIIVVMQRLHEQDVSGHILASNAGYTHLCLPMIAEERQTLYFPITKKEFIREEGDILQPERFSKENLDQLKRDMGSYAFSGQYQQEPTPKGGGMFKKWWWRFWVPEGQLDKYPPVAVKDEKGQIIYIKPIEKPNCEEQAQSWDAAFKGGDENDFVCGGVWERKGADRFFIHRDMRKLGFSDTLRAITKMSEAYPMARRKLIEDKANGPAIIDSLKNSLEGVIPINPGSDSKEARAESITPIVEAGNVYLPHPMMYDWVDDFINNCAKFPKVQHDDDVDQMVQILIYWSKKKPRNIGSV